MIDTSQGDTACPKLICDQSLFALTLALNFHLEIIINTLQILLFADRVLLSICPEVHATHKKLSESICFAFSKKFSMPQLLKLIRKD
ncbi:hypothetical protein VNO78_03127 [Psophocarpus tetragonolobus]|uniref:Uncharacterized protein n=1 Tax=Psophocarpus tetragonolobus TaxID=3891 RepID=A0AAN9XVC2_PSOTE